MAEQKGAVVGSQAPDFRLKDQLNKEWSLSDLTQGSAVMLVFYPGDFTPVCTKQLCDYRDSMETFDRFQIRVVGISANDSVSHAEFSEKYRFRFPLLSDPGHQVAKAYGCTSLLMFGGVSRGVFIISKDEIVRYRYVEPTAITRRKGDDLLKVIQDLKAKGQID